MYNRPVYAAAVYSHGYQGITQVCSVFLCVRIRLTDVRRGKSGRQQQEKEREKDEARGDEEIKFLLSLKNLLYKTNYFSKESFHHCIAVGLCALT